jgi:hypothetical protein
MMKYKLYFILLITELKCLKVIKLILCKVGHSNLRLCCFGSAKCEQEYSTIFLLLRLQQINVSAMCYGFSITNLLILASVQQ